MTLVEAILRGEAKAEDWQEWVCRWHSCSLEVPLAEYLGLTNEEYACLLDGGPGRMIEPVSAPQVFEEAVARRRRELVQEPRRD